MTQSIFDLTGETAVVLGGTGVLGGGMASALASAGATVAIVGRNAERGMERVRTIEAAGGRAIFQAADALDVNSLSEARDAIVRELGSVTVLIAAAGGNRPDATLPPGSSHRPANSGGRCRCATSSAPSQISAPATTICMA